MDLDLEPDVRRLVRLTSQAAELEQRLIQRALDRHGDEGLEVLGHLVARCSAEAPWPQPHAAENRGVDTPEAIQEEGAQAYRTGLEIAANPYKAKRRTWRSRAWETGWKNEEQVSRAALVLPDFLREPLPLPAADGVS